MRKKLSPAAAAMSLLLSIHARTHHSKSTLSSTMVAVTVTALPILSTSPSRFIHSSTTLFSLSLGRPSPRLAMFYSSSTTINEGTDNFSRYSKFLVKHSNGVDGMGGQQNNDREKMDEHSIVWMDSLGLFDKDGNDVDNTKKHTVEESNTLLPHSQPTMAIHPPPPPPPPFSVLSWNILAQSLYESHYQMRRIQRVALEHSINTSNISQAPLFHSLSSSSSPHPHPWPKRLRRIIEILSHAKPDIICLQECEIQSFQEDLVPALSNLGYDGIAQEDDRTEIPTPIKEVTKHHRNPRNHIVATFWKRDKMEPVGAALVRTRSLTTVLRLRGDDITFPSQSGRDDKDAATAIAPSIAATTPTTTTTTTMTTSPTIAIVNVHLEGNPRRFSERTRQLQHALSDLAIRMEQTNNNKYQSSSSSACPSEDKSCLHTLNALVIAGDFNCELQSSACSTYLRMGRLGRHAGLGGIHGEDAIVVPPSFLESTEATEVIHPIMEWGRALPEEELVDIDPHPFRRNGMTSAYPIWLGKDNARSHFTFCSELTKRPVPGLDQIWFSSMTLKRTGLKRMFVNDSEEWERCFFKESEMEKWREEERRKVLANGLPSLDCKYPSDHLPIGAIFDWKRDHLSDDSSILDGRKEIRRLTVVDSLGNNIQSNLVQGKPRVPQLVFENPDEELKYLLENCPYDSNEQKSAVQFILSPISPPLSLFFTPNETPTEDQMAQIEARRAKKVEVLSTSTLVVRPWLKQIWKANKQAVKWNRCKLKHKAR